jgi:hypothetical protein
MSHIRIDKQKAIKKWTPVLENMGVKDSERIDWMAEYAEFHSINENAYVNQHNLAGLGNALSPQPSSIPGQTIGAYTTNGGVVGSGDIGQQLLPVAMKIAAQTIGLDLVAVKPTPGPKIDLLYVDFAYDDTPMGEGRPQVFKVNNASAAAIANLRTLITIAGAREVQGGLTGAKIWVSINATASGTFSYGATENSAPANKKGWVEFLGFSRIDGYPMLRAYRQNNYTGQNNWAYDQTVNTFTSTGDIASQITMISGVAFSSAAVELISALEDHIPGFVSNWADNNLSPMNRNADENSYPGIIAPRVSSKSVQVGTIEISSALKRTEIEDIKANTGMDIVQKMESILVNELSQTISKQIVAKIFEMGDLNRASAPTLTATAGIADRTIFDFDVTSYLATNAPGGETSHAVQRKLISKIFNASNYLATEGRIGPAQFAVTNGNLASVLMDISGYTINPAKSKLNTAGQLYPVGTIGDITIYVDPYMKYNDNRIVLGRKNNPDQPGIIFVPYLMAQSISIISEATFAPRMLLRSRYAVTEVGWFPQKQYMTLKVYDANQNLI